MLAIGGDPEEIARSLPQVMIDYLYLQEPSWLPLQSSAYEYPEPSQLPQNFHTQLAHGGGQDIPLLGSEPSNNHLPVTHQAVANQTNSPMMASDLSKWSPSWHEIANVDESIFQRFTSKWKLEAIVVHGAIEIGDELERTDFDPLVEPKCEVFTPSLFKAIMNLIIDSCEKVVGITSQSHLEVRVKSRTRASRPPVISEVATMANIISAISVMARGSSTFQDSKASYKSVGVRRRGQYLGTLYDLRQSVHVWLDHVRP